VQQKVASSIVISHLVIFAIEPKDNT